VCSAVEGRGRVARVHRAKVVATTCTDRGDHDDDDEERSAHNVTSRKRRAMFGVVSRMMERLVN
jgi:hypothetical protein